MTVELSTEQLHVVSTSEPALVVTASAGSGKTEVVARRVERLLAESPNEPFRVLALSYTVKAADELRDRLTQQLGDTRRVDTDTIHAFAHTLLRQHGTWDGLPAEPEVLYRDEDRVELLTEWLAGLGTFLEPEYARTLLQGLDLARARLEDAAYLSEYNDALNDRGALDYPSMLERASHLLANEWVREQLVQTYRHLIVDEAQNLTPAQYRFLTAMLGPSPSPINAMLVGDEKQSIVQFAGAEPRLIKQFENDYGAQRIPLTRNFRSATAIAGIADVVSASLGDRGRLQVVSAAPGLVEFGTSATEHEEGQAVARWIANLLRDGLPATAVAPGETAQVSPEDIAVLARTGAALRWTADALGDGAIDFVLGSDPRNWMSSRLGQAVADLIAFHAGPHHPSAQAHLAASAGAPLDDLGSSPLPGLADLVAASDGRDPMRLFAAIDSVGEQNGIDPAWVDDKAVLTATWHAFLDRTPSAERGFVNLQLHIARTQRGEPSAPGVRLLTVHKSQGREFRAVAVVGLNDGQFPDFRQTTEKERRAELHCFYVAITRASRVLRLSRARQRVGRNGLWEATESEYLRLARRAGRKS